MKLTAILLLAVTLTACAAAAENTLQPGLTGRYYQMTNSLQDFPAIPTGKKPDVERVDKQINFASTLEAFPGTKLVDNFYVVWTGKIRIPADGAYTFFLESDDGSRLFIDGAQVVDNGGLHEMQESLGKVELKAGDHVIKVEFFDAEEDAGCILSWKSPKIEKQVVPENVLFH
jgi:hypothetical protein